MPTIIVRPVGNTCNLACKYCYVDAVVSPNMSIAIFKKGLERITSFYLGENIKNIEILFHGGEPLLWGLNKYKKAEKVISESEEKYSIKYIKCIQTNLICYDSKFATFFKKNNYFIGTSIDGNKSQNIIRLCKNGSETFDIILNNLQILKKYQNSVGAVVTVGKYNSNAKTLFEFLESNSINANINLLFSSNFALTLDEKKAFFRKLVDIYLSKDPANFKIKTIDQYIMKAIYGKEINTCEFNNKSLDKKRQFALDSDGKVYFCNRFAGLPDKEKYFLFDITDNRSLDDQMAENGAFKAIVAKEKKENSSKLLVNFNAARGCFYKNIIYNSLYEDANLKKDNYEYICKKLKIAGVI